MTVGKVCNRQVTIVDIEDSILDAVHLMRRHHVGDVIVTRPTPGGRRPVGILTDRDIVIEVMAQKLDPDSLIVKDIMSTDPVSVTVTTSLLDTLELMKQRGVRRVLVVADDGSLQGLLSADDAIELIAEQLNDLTQLVNREVTREQKQHP